MKLVINGNDYHYAFEQLIRVFSPDLLIEKIYNSPLPEGEFILCAANNREGGVEIEVRVCLKDFKRSESKFIACDEPYKTGELAACQILFGFLKEYTSYTPLWGIQTGVRPSKIYFNLLRNNTPEQAVKYLQEQLLIQPQKALLVQKVCQNEEQIIRSAKEEQFSLYVSIPFCPSRCSYCSFISHAYESIKKLIPEYVRLLCEEIRALASHTNALGLKLRTVYIGGGTPTVLDCEQLGAIFKVIEENFDLTELTEYTLEAGRPDTLSEEKLAFIALSKVTRLTINAQSFNDEILSSIGRRHTAQDIFDAYARARKCGFDTINTDLIAGLEGESVESFLDSVQKAIALDAENITIHTLALKRSSFMRTRDNAKSKVIAQTSRMIDCANEMLEASGYIPYYMYRQSKSVGNLENTGWAKPNKRCEYNVFMMEEVQNVFGVGAGAVTRLVHADNHKIVRINNFKYPYEYISGFDVILERKKQAAQMYQNIQKP